MPSAILVEKRKELDGKRERLSKIFEQAGSDLDLSKVEVEGLKDLADGKARADKVRELHDELDSLGQEVHSLAEVDRIGEEARKRRMEEQRQKDGDKGDGGKGGLHGDPDDPARKQPLKTVDDLIADILATDALNYKNVKGGRGPVASIEIPTGKRLKTLFQTSAGWTPETTRTGRLVEFATRPLQVSDILPIGATGQTSVVYMEETTFTNAAAETAEGALKPESALAYTEKSSPVRKIATILPVTDEQLQDVVGIQSLLENRLMFMVRQRLDGQILNGDGIAPNLTGIMETTGTQTYTTPGDETFIESARRAMTMVRVTGRANPTAFVVHPETWTDVVLTRTTDGMYIWGHPSAPGPGTLWGLPVVESDHLAETEALVGDFASFSELVIRSDMDVQVSNSHEDFFARNQQAIRAEMRAAIVVYRPTAFVEITAIGATAA